MEWVFCREQPGIHSRGSSRTVGQKVSAASVGEHRKGLVVLDAATLVVPFSVHLLPPAPPPSLSLAESRLAPISGVCYVFFSFPLKKEKMETNTTDTCEVVKRMD